MSIFKSEILNDLILKLEMLGNLRKIFIKLKFFPLAIKCNSLLGNRAEHFIRLLHTLSSRIWYTIAQWVQNFFEIAFIFWYIPYWTTTFYWFYIKGVSDLTAVIFHQETSRIWNLRLQKSFSPIVIYLV